MRVFSNAITLIELFKDYRSMDSDDKNSFYQSKCDYYQNYVSISLYAGVLFSITFLYSDYLLNGSFLPTLLPRLSILAALLLFILITHFTKKRSITVFMDFFLAHCIVFATIWSIYHLDNKIHASEGFIIMNLVFLTVGFVAKPKETVISSLIFIFEIIISHSFNHYSNVDIILALQVPSALAVITSHFLLMLFYLDHYRVRQKLELAMVTDPLTQVYNRHLLERIVTKNALKDVHGPIAIAMLDIDYFKQVNDEYGHYTGDLTLLYIGQKLSKGTHEDDYVIRYGGEEFIIILKDCDVNNACARMEQFRQEIENATDTPVSITVSIGVSRYNGDFSKSIQNVDHALYKAKNSGRNMVVVV
ncbi:GGDEF domain-containing protein [Butyrivibrio sp. YAB3001]|uniref:GGDEF domain-containing protein n=1 Tax=Butyrivibrio sp. YAB3001 TaxID=1520812 RepID=UPI0008F63E5D|nr:GGDEF domain-containing protein [Butyrivibrio sp. YAB3001]SFB76701.1 diguanylate cyclase (GGDEF) domain-containing protein [Butyrivibrio sp. YAB3001]